jgi:hypothetical protein
MKPPVDWTRFVDPATSWSERRRVLEQAVGGGHRTLAGLREDARAAGFTVPARVPSLEGDVLVVTAALTDPADIRALLRPGGPGQDALLGARLALAASRLEVQVARAHHQDLLPLLGDPRPCWPDRPDTVGETLQTTHVLLVLEGARSGDDREAWLREALLQGVRAAFRAGGVRPPSLSYVNAWHNNPRAPVEDLAREAVAVLRDTTRPALTRLAGRAFLDAMSGFLRFEGDRPIDDDTRSRFQAVLEDGNQALVEILADAGAPADLRAAVVAQVTSWLADRVVALQDAGLLPVQDVPSWREFKERKEPGAVRALSARVRLADVVATMRDADRVDGEKVFTALRLVDHLAAWMPGAAPLLEPVLRPLLSTPLTVTWPVKGQPKTVKLAAEAATAYTALLWRVEPATGTPSLPWLEEAAPDALRRALEHGHHTESLASALKKLCPPALRKQVGELVRDMALAPSATADMRRSAATALESLGLRSLAKEVEALLR